jgi:hypothetical protein
MAEESVILGQALDHEYIEEVEIVCQPEYICMVGFVGILELMRKLHCAGQKFQGE